MKKINSFWIFLLTMLVTSFSASALKLTFQWDIPGSVIIRTGSISGDLVELEPGATSYTVTTEGNTSIPYIYFFPAEGYVLTTMELPNGQTASPSTNSTYGQFWGRNYTSGFMSGWGDNPIVKVGCKVLERNDVLNINVENGANCIQAVFSGLNYEPELHDGMNTVHFDAEVEKSLTLSWINGATDFYSLTLNGTRITTKPYSWSSYCTLDNLCNGDNIVIRVFENDSDVPEDVTLNIILPEGLENCIMNVRNWSNSTFMELENNSLTVAKGTDLALNFNDGYTFTKFMLGDQDITSNYSEMSNRLRFILNETADLEIFGAPTAYDNVNYTAYVMNPEGVNLYLGRYRQNPADLSGGEDVSEDIEVQGFTLTSVATKSYSLEVSEESPIIYVAPKDGWFIATVQAKEDNNFEIINNVSPEYPTFYVIALPLENNASMRVNVTGNKALLLSGNAALATTWDNPEQSFGVSEGENTVNFNKDYNVPFSLRPLELFNNFEVYLDGAKLTVDEESGAASIAPYTGPDKSSVVTVYANGTSTGKIVTTNVTCEGTTATAFYGGALTYTIPLGKDTKYLQGTPTTIVPVSADCSITLNGNLVHGMKEDGTFLDGLNEEGQYVFSPDYANANVVVKVSKVVPISVNPASGSTLPKISEIKVEIPMLDSDNMMNTTPEALAGISIAKKDGSIVETSFELGEVGMNSDYTAFSYPLILETPITVADDYVVTIPEGTFFESAWDDASESFVKVENGFVNMALTAEYTVDPTAKSPIENIIVLPADGSALSKLAVVYVNFPDFGQYDMSLQCADGAQALFSNGTKEIRAEIYPNWGTEPFRSFMIMIYDEDYNEAPITEAGTWTMSIPAGMFRCGSEASPAIEAVYEIGADYPPYPIIPTPGTVTTDLSKFTITFVGAESSDYVLTEGGIILTGDNFESASSDVKATDESNQFEILFQMLPSEAGEYTLTIPAGAFKVNDMDCEEITATYTYRPGSDSGVNGIAMSTDGLYNVVGIDGSVIFNGVTVDKVKTLPRGLYIINGRKVIVK